MLDQLFLLILIPVAYLAVILIAELPNWLRRG